MDDEPSREVKEQPAEGSTEGNQRPEQQVDNRWAAAYDRVCANAEYRQQSHQRHANRERSQAEQAQWERVRITILQHHLGKGTCTEEQRVELDQLLRKHGRL